MHCPNDGATLLLTSRRDVEIDYCPTCRGVWLDRGELDKLIERDEHRRMDFDDDDDHDQHGRFRPRPKKKKKGWLSEVFEFE